MKSSCVANRNTGGKGERESEKLRKREKGGDKSGETASDTDSVLSHRSQSCKKKFLCENILNIDKYIIQDVLL